MNPLIRIFVSFVGSISCPYRAPTIAMRIIDKSCWVLYCSLTVVVVASVLSTETMEILLSKTDIPITYKSYHPGKYLECLDRRVLHRCPSCTIDWRDSTIWKWRCARHHCCYADGPILSPRVFLPHHVTIQDQHVKESRASSNDWLLLGRDLANAKPRFRPTTIETPESDIVQSYRNSRNARVYSNHRVVQTENEHRTKEWTSVTQLPELGRPT